MIQLFQAWSRNSDMVLSRSSYDYSQLSRVDYLWPLGTHGIYPVTGKRREIKNYLTMIKPFDKYTWGLLAVSVTVVISTFLVVDKFYIMWKNTRSRVMIHQSKRNLCLYFYYI